MPGNPIVKSWKPLRFVDMPIRVCRRCGKNYDGAQGSSLCPVCVEVQKHKSSSRPRVCKTCSTAFWGGPRAYYCPDCRAERKKEQFRLYHLRKAAGKVRKIGSTDICTVCGKEYTVSSGNQRFCEECAAEAKKARSLAVYYADPDRIERKKEFRAAGNPTAQCIICGKEFTQTGHWLTCSKECSRIHADQLAAKWRAENSELRATLNKDWYQKFFESLTPEELEQYREKKRAAARIQYANKKREQNE